MSRTLPPRPNLEQLKKQAKDLLKAHRAGDASCCSTLRRLDRLKNAGDADILAAKLKLDDCQFALAMDYGFKSWMQMKALVESVETTRAVSLPLTRGSGLHGWGTSNPEDVRIEGDTWVFTGKEVKAEVGGMSWDNYILIADVQVVRTAPGGTYRVQLTGRGTTIYCQLVPGWIQIAYFDELPKGQPKGFTHLARREVDVPERTWVNLRMMAAAGTITAFLDGREIVSATVPCGTQGMPGLLVNGQENAEVRVKNIQVEFLNPTPEQLAEYETEAIANWNKYVEKHGGDMPDARQPAGGILDQVRQLSASFRDDDLHQRSEIDVLQILLHVAGRTEADYATLMAVSGWSGQFVYNAKPDWPTFVSPGPTIDRACAAVGAQVEHYTPKSAEEAMTFIGESIRQGRPVRVNYMEDGLFADFVEESGQAKAFFMCIPFAAKGEWWTLDDLHKKWWEGVWDKGMHRIIGLVEPANPRGTASRVMADLVRLGTVPYWNNARMPDVLTGLAAIERYADDIADPSKAMVDNNGTNKGTSFFARGWGCYAIYPQWTARECTARYLDGVAALFESTVGEHIRAAARLYHEAYGHWRQWERHLGRAEDLGTYDARWADPAHRAAGSAAARDALSSEKKAIAELRTVLTMLPMSAELRAEGRP